MEFIYYYEFDGRFMRDPIPDETKIRIAKERAAEELAKKFVEEALIEVTHTGAVKILIRT